MRQTENYALNLPEGQDNYNKNDYNENFDIIDKKMKELAKYIIPGENIDSINIVAELPVELVENAMYLIPIIEQLVPAIPNDTGYEKFIIVANVENALVNYSLATEFYLFAGSKLATRGSYPEDLTMGNANSQTAFSKIYRYIVGGDFEWVEYTDINWTNNVPIHKITNVIYASENIVRNTVGTVIFAPEQNIIKSDGTYADADFPSQYQTYYVLDGEAKRRGTTNLSWILNNLLDIVKPITITENGTYTPNNFNVFGYGPITANVGEPSEVLVRNFDFTQSIIDSISSVEAKVGTNVDVTADGLSFFTTSNATINPMYDFNLGANYDISFMMTFPNDLSWNTIMMGIVGGGFYLTIININNDHAELGYKTGTGDDIGTSTGINIETLSNKEIKVEMRHNQSNWDIYLSIEDLNYHQKVAEINAMDYVSYLRFGDTSRAPGRAILKNTSVTRIKEV